MSLRSTLETRKAQPTMEGAGVHLHRAFGFQDPSELDPFLLFDDFRNDVPAHYLQGFPWHPHRGIETITFVLSETVEHGDSLGNTGASAPAMSRGWPQARAACTRDANGKCQGPDARLSTLGQFTRSAENDRAAISGRLGQRYPPCER